MLLGHFAAGLAAKRLAPRVPMALLLAAPMFLDLLWPLLYFAGVERFDVRQDQQGFLALELIHVPYTHGLLASVLWSALAFALWLVLRRDARGALVVGALVFSHWFLDFIAHVPDLPVASGDDLKLGLGLWRSVWGTLLVEGALFAGCLALYLKSTAPRARSGTVAIASLVSILLVVYLGTMFGPPPPSADAMAAFALLGFAAIPFGRWLDRSRTVVVDER